MKKIKKLLKKLNNRGSSIIMVIVALGFIGIIVGALLMAAGYAYRLKMQDLNARDNFYYVEQAMNEIYAGVGSQTVQDMKDAYQFTVENMVYYDTTPGVDGYRTLSDQAANDMFRQQFLYNVTHNPFFNAANIADSLETLITNETVKLDKDKLVLEVKSDGVYLKNVTLTREQEYNRSTANGVFTQTISADIVIGEPDFYVNFNNAVNAYDNLFNFALVADMGVEVTQPATSLTIAGNVYAAADYYNKNYNESTWGGAADSTKVITPAKEYTDPSDPSGKITYDYKHGSVTSKKYNPSSPATSGYYNTYEQATHGVTQFYDGINQKSMYSGFYVDGSSVSIMANTIIVPGTIAVMNAGSLSVFGKEGLATSEAELWADNIVLAGYSKKASASSDAMVGASAVIRAHIFMKDDAEINAAYAKLQVRGSYYGYGDSTSKDTRTFIPTVDPVNFQVPTVDASGNQVMTNRGHYNSSAIIVNGENSTLDLAETTEIFLAGRSYIEMSKLVDNSSYSVDANGNVLAEDQLANAVEDRVEQTYQFAPTYQDAANQTVYVRDYKTGESISLRSNQVAYIPVMSGTAPKFIQPTDGSRSYYLMELPVVLRGIDLYEHYFNSAVFGTSVPCIAQDVSGKRYYYYDFETAWNNLSATAKANYPSAQALAAAFIEEYVTYYNEISDVVETGKIVVNGTRVDASESQKNTYERQLAVLVDIGDYEDFDFTEGSILVPDPDNSVASRPITIYSSGAITTKNGTTFNMITSGDVNNIDLLLSSYNTTSDVASGDIPLRAYQYSNNLELEYEYVKWNLGHYTNSADPEKLYINDLLASAEFSEADLTPINKYIYMDKITDSVYLHPSATGAGSAVLNLPSGYRVWLNGGDRNIVITATSDDEIDSGLVRGIVVSKGDVYFDASVKSFEGLVVSGGKIYITNNLENITASAEICRAILKECQLSSDPGAQLFLSIFRGYDDLLENTASETDAKTIDTIDYSDVVKFENWMKNVE